MTTPINNAVANVRISPAAREVLDTNHDRTVTQTELAAGLASDTVRFNKAGTVVPVAPLTLPPALDALQTENDQLKHTLETARKALVQAGPAVREAAADGGGDSLYWIDRWEKAGAAAHGVDTALREALTTVPPSRSTPEGLTGEAGQLARENAGLREQLAAAGRILDEQRPALDAVDRAQGMDVADWENQWLTASRLASTLLEHTQTALR